MTYYWLFTLISAALCLLGFRHHWHFVSVSYALSMVAISLVALVAPNTHLSVLSGAVAAIFLSHGLRLSAFLVHREYSAAFASEHATLQAKGRAIGLGLRALIWVGCSALYPLLFFPLWSLLQRPAVSELGILGALMMALGFGLEVISDLQKTLFKREHPSCFCDRGLYRWSRHPNFLGEMVFWLGLWTASVPSYRDAGDWVLGVLSLLCIEWVMLGSTQRLERKQQARYGQRPSYQAFCRDVPALLPFLPARPSALVPEPRAST